MDQCEIASSRRTLGRHFLSSVRRDRALIRKFAESEGPDGGGNTFWFHWFSTDTYELHRSSLPAIQRLIIAWSDGQPDVPESDLMQLGEASSFEQLWVKPIPGGVALYGEAQPQPKDKPQFDPPAFLVPGSTPVHGESKNRRTGLLLQIRMNQAPMARWPAGPPAGSPSRSQRFPVSKRLPSTPPRLACPTGREVSSDAGRAGEETNLKTLGCPASRHGAYSLKAHIEFRGTNF